VALVLCRWNTLLIVLEALGLSHHCRQKCDISAISDERLHSSSLKNWPGWWIGAVIKCDNCDEEHATSPKPTKCINCEGPDPAFSKQCPKYKQEQEIITLKYTLTISFPEAGKSILNKPISYASVSRKTTTSTATQTDHPSEQLIPTKSDIP